MLLMEGPTDWDRLKTHGRRREDPGRGRFRGHSSKGPPRPDWPVVLLKMPEAPVYEKLTQALLESVADDILAAGAQVVALYSGFEAARSTRSAWCTWASTWAS